MNTNQITYESGTYRTMTMEYKLVQGGNPKVQITHRKIGSQWWDIAYGDKMHTQATWDAIKKQGTKIS